MVFIKVVKTNAYFKRFQVKFRRRREGKTDYRARKFLTFQHKNKYNTPKYRFVVRFTNTNIIAQIIYSTIVGDRVLSQAQSKELAKFGLDTGFTNYPAAYATGLLLARRTLKQLGLDDLYKGVAAPTGAAFDVYKDMEARESKGEEIKKRPFKAYLDVGLVCTTTGNKVFGALKGACDGGIHIPHSVKRFPGSKKEDGKWKYDAEVHRKRIYGVHIQEYMKLLKEEDEEKFSKQFTLWNEKLGGKTVEQTYKGIFEAIRKDPSHVKKDRAHAPVHTREGQFIKTHTATYPRNSRLTRAERKERVNQKIINAAKSQA
mmetsp:Transcript_32036/g.31751  ORF Transcript_32036/g.31751 Transcript_32036/m.31751 type:complete len:316 (+) Transcript_32036:23-970(+)